MNLDVQGGGRNERHGSCQRAWRTPLFTDYDIMPNTEITNCGSSSDNVICQNPAS